jgi:hypothetical protein
MLKKKKKEVWQSDSSACLVSSETLNSNPSTTK